MTGKCHLLKTSPNTEEQSLPRDCWHGISKNLKIGINANYLNLSSWNFTPHYHKLVYPCLKSRCAKILAQALEVFEEGTLPPCTPKHRALHTHLGRWIHTPTLQGNVTPESVTTPVQLPPSLTYPKGQDSSADGQTAVNLTKWLKLSLEFF